MSDERMAAIVLANTVLDRVNADPDDDLAVLARQFLREVSRSQHAEVALDVRARDVQALQEDIAKLMRVMRCAQSALVTVRNDVAREKLQAAIAAVPHRLKAAPHELMPYAELRSIR